LPLDGEPSTHLLKPDPLDAPFGSAGNEVFCTRLAHRCELTTVDTELLQLPGRLVFVTSRYDRRMGAGGVQRIHQEDLCQAFGRWRGDKCERPGERRLRETAQLLSKVADRGSVVRFLQMATFNVAIGNTDAHSKNFGLMHDENGEVKLAPLYDVACHVIRPGHPVDPAMWINEVSSVHTVTTQDLVREAATWKVRLNGKQAYAVVMETLELMRSEVAVAERDVWVDEQVVATVSDRIDALLAGRSAGEST
jgi:serine/threonine-protein kinase HipA